VGVVLLNFFSDGGQGKRCRLTLFLISNVKIAPLFPGPEAIAFRPGFFVQ